MGTFVLMWTWSNSLQSYLQVPARPLAHFLHNPLLPSTLDGPSPNCLILLGKLRCREGAKPQSDTVRGCQCRARAPLWLQCHPPPRAPHLLLPRLKSQLFIYLSIISLAHSISEIHRGPPTCQAEADQEMFAPGWGGAGGLGTDPISGTG